MFAKVKTAGLLGIDGFLAEVEADVQNGLPGFYLTGALSPETREAQLRVWNALRNSGIRPDPRKITVNFSPASVRKDGTSYDLPIAVAVLSAMEILDYTRLEDTAFFGEVGLDGSLKKVRGALPLAFTLKKNNIRRLIVPSGNSLEAELAEGIEVFGCGSLSEVIELVLGGFEAGTGHANSFDHPSDDGGDWFRIDSSGDEVFFTPAEDDGYAEAGFSVKSRNSAPDSTGAGNCPAAFIRPEESCSASAVRNTEHSAAPCQSASASASRQSDGVSPAMSHYDVDFSEVHGQEYLKRAAEIAVSGRHNLLMSGPAGTGKTMIARRMPTIMPDLTRDEDIEISKVYSICGLLPEDRPLLSRRPFRSPHHGISDAALAGGGSMVMPGEISLASGGILFLDEIPLFSRTALEMLRQPMEEGRITVTRIKGSYVYPADFMLVAAMNNCACGFYPDKKKCTCTRAQIKAYMGRLSRPLMERIDICAEARPVGFSELSGDSSGECSADIRKRVERVYAVQAERFRDSDGIRFNSRMKIRDIEKHCVLGRTEQDFIRETFKTRNLSGRTYHKILKVARTIADMDDRNDISVEHLIEAVGLRSIEDELFRKRDPGYS